MLCDYFKPRPQLEAEIVILRHQLTYSGERHAGRICVGSIVLCSSGCIVAALASFAPSPSLGPRPSCVGIAWVLPLTGGGSLVRPVADRGSPKRCAT
jgi:hypothetical protein